MPEEYSATDLGLIRIHKNAIAQAASLAALEVDGVKRIGGGFKGSIMAFIGKGPAGIKVEISKTEEVKLEIPLFIKYGFNIPDIASRVQENVRQVLEKMTNLSIKAININIQGVESLAVSARQGGHR